MKTILDLIKYAAENNIPLNTEIRVHSGTNYNHKITGFHLRGHPDNELEIEYEEPTF